MRVLFAEWKFNEVWQVMYVSSLPLSLTSNTLYQESCGTLDAT